MRHVLATLMLGLTLAGCATSAQNTATVSVADACSGYATAIDRLTPVKAQLDAATVSAVNTANSLTGPLCAPGTVPTDVPAAISFIAGETQAIIAIAFKHGV